MKIGTFQKPRELSKAASLEHGSGLNDLLTSIGVLYY